MHFGRLTFIVFFSLVLNCPVLSSRCDAQGQINGQSVEDDIDENAISNVMKMIADLGGQANVKLNSGKKLNCIYRGSKKVSIVTKDDITTFSGVYQNCREPNSIRDGIYKIKVVDNVIVETSTLRSINGELFDAVAANDLKKINNLISAKADVNYTESLSLNDGNEVGEWTPLMLAVMTRNLDAVKLLISSGAWINYMNTSAFNALWLATDIDRLDMVKYLAEHGAYINNSNHENVTPLMTASIRGNYDMVEYLIGLHADINRTHKDGDSALMFAIAGGHSRIAKLLLESGANIQFKNRYGISALLIAAAEGNAEIVKILIDRKADIAAKSDTGKTALDVAKAKGYATIVEMLEKASQQVN